MELQAKPLTLHAMKQKMEVSPAASCYLRIPASGYREHLTHGEMSIALDAAYKQSLDGPLVAFMGCVDAQGLGKSLGEVGLTLSMMDAARAAVADARSRAGAMMSANIQGPGDPTLPSLQDLQNLASSVLAPHPAPPPPPPQSTIVIPSVDDLAALGHQLFAPPPQRAPMAPPAALDHSLQDLANLAHGVSQVPLEVPPIPGQHTAPSSSSSAPGLQQLANLGHQLLQPANVEQVQQLAKEARAAVQPAIVPKGGSVATVFKVLGVLVLAGVAGAAFWFGVEKKTRRRHHHHHSAHR